MRIKLTMLLLMLQSFTVTAQPTVPNIGKMPGEKSSLAKSSGTPGKSPVIIIRCRATIQQGNVPLYVVDGVPYEPDQIKSIKPNDIESIDIIKAPLTEAIFSCRAPRSAVIIITTKKAYERKFTIKDSKDRVGVGFATITATSLKTGDSVSFVANEFGRIKTDLLKSLDYKLKISSAGYKTRELSLRDIARNRNEILLQRDVIELKSVDVVGYRTIRCRTISCGMQGVSICRWVTNKQGNQLNNVSPKWNVYPNPVAQSGTISISFPNVKEGLYQIRLTGSSGQLIYSCQKQISSKNQTEQIHLTAHTAAGIYLLQIVDEQHKTVQSSKLIVQ